MIEDSPIDADLVRSFLDKCPFEYQLTRVETRPAFTAALERGGWSVILSDFALPEFDGLSALGIAHQLAPHVPFLFVSGVLGEEVAVDTLNKGATDYVLKKNLARLPAAVDRALALGRERAERRNAEAELHRAKEAAESANRAKDDFLAALSHELRTPLMPILATVQLWQSGGKVPPEMREGVEVIRRNVELEARLIDDLLDLTRISRGKLLLNLEPVDLHDLLDQVAEICRADLEGKRHRLAVHFDAASPVLDGDVARLHQVFWNLLKNAVKFTPDGGEVTVRTFDVDENRIAVEVSDNGVGIAADALPRIFAAFEQADRSVARRFGGLGLGLSIAKALVETHHGTLHASSAGVGRGAMFTVVLPLAGQTRESSADSLIKSAAGVDGDGDHDGRPPGLRVLLVEDHADTAHMMLKLLTSQGHDVCLAGTVKEATGQLAAKRFDVLISDIGLPDGSGIDVVQHAGAASVPSVAISGFGMDHDVQRARRAGFHEHLTKPVDFKKLMSIVYSLTRRPGRD